MMALILDNLLFGMEVGHSICLSGKKIGQVDLVEKY